MQKKKIIIVTLLHGLNCTVIFNYYAVLFYTFKLKKMNNLTFYGTDASIETSLFEYGLIVSNEPNEDKSGSHFCIYKISENRFSTGNFADADINDLINGKDWIDLTTSNQFLDYCGQTIYDFLNSTLASKLQSLIQYFGTENICGTDYYPITEKEVIELYIDNLK